jgi:hypothetical protein
MMAADGYRQQSTKSGNGNGGCDGDSDDDNDSEGDGNGKGATSKVTTINNKWQQKKWRWRCGAFCK